MTYDEILMKADEEGFIVREKPLESGDGRNFGRRIAIRKDIPHLKQKTCVVAEEMGHYYTTVGNILDQTKIENRKQERHARVWAYNELIGLMGIIRAYENGCQSRYEMAEYLDVDEEFLKDALAEYESKYGLYVKLDNYIIYFNKGVSVLKMMQ